MTHLSRREFAAFTVSAIAAPLALPSRGAAAAPIPAADVIERIRKNIGVEWKPETVDTIKSGDPATLVSGVVTTAMASLSVLQQAVTAGANLVITCEPTFYSRDDVPNPPAGRGAGPAPAAQSAAPPSDPVYAAKNAFIAKNKLVVFRLSEHWRLRRPDPFARGLAGTLGSTVPQGADIAARYAVPPTTLSSFAAEIGKKLGSRGGIRVVGDPQTMVRTAALLPGSTPIAAALEALPAADVVVAGEVREWESVEYARDVAFSGQRKGLILIGRVVSEEGGMRECARWLGTLVPEVPVRHVPTGDPYWRPA